MHEIIIGEIYSVLLGPSRGPNIALFERFQQCWPTINQANLLHWMMLSLLNHCYSSLDQKLATFSSLSCQVTLQVHTYHEKTTKR